MFLIGLTLLIVGIIAESSYVVSSKVAYNGPTLSTELYFVSGIFFIVLGFILTVSSARIPKIHIS